MVPHASKSQWPPTNDPEIFVLNAHLQKKKGGGAGDLAIEVDSNQARPPVAGFVVGSIVLALRHQPSSGLCSKREGNCGRRLQILGL